MWRARRWRRRQWEQFVRVLLVLASWIVGEQGLAMGSPPAQPSVVAAELAREPGAEDDLPEEDRHLPLDGPTSGVRPRGHAVGHFEGYLMGQ